MQPTSVFLDSFRQTVCISSELGHFPSNHVLPLVDFEPLWVWARPFVFLHFFPVELSPSPPLKASTSQFLRTNFFAIHPCHMASPAEHTISDGHQHIHIAFLDPSMTSPVPESPPLTQLHSWRPFHSNSIRRHSRTPARNFVSLCLDRRPDTRAPEESLPHCSFYNVQPQALFTQICLFQRATGHTELMMLDINHASQPWEGGRGAPLCGPPPRQSLERGGIAVRAALAACQNGSRCCATSLGRRTRAQRNRSRRKRSTFLWGARCARGPTGLPFAEFHDDGDTCDSLYEYQCLSGYGMVPKDNDVYSPKNVPFDTQRDLRCAKNVSANLRRCSGAMTGTSLGLHPVNINACPRVKDRTRFSTT